MAAPPGAWGLCALGTSLPFGRSLHSVTIFTFTGDTSLASADEWASALCSALIPRDFNLLVETALPFVSSHQRAQVGSASCCAGPSESGLTGNAAQDAGSGTPELPRAGRRRRLHSLQDHHQLSARKG